VEEVLEHIVVFLEVMVVLVEVEVDVQLELQVEPEALPVLILQVMDNQQQVVELAVQVQLIVEVVEVVALVEQWVPAAPVAPV
jgi:hypothetical protein